MIPLPDAPLASLLADLAVCRICRDAPVRGGPLPHEPRPIVQAHEAARICIASQAPGNRAHVAGVPFLDPSGVRLRAWLGMDEATFYDPRRIAIVPMGHCFPGYDSKGGDLPPRTECAPAWRRRIFEQLPNLELILVVGSYAQKWHLPQDSKVGLTGTVRGWRAILDAPRTPRVLPLPHPSWRNNAWLRRHPWFEDELLPVLRRSVQSLLAGSEREDAA